jgi:nucleoside-diphosphate-sugar epimerase
MKCVITGHTSGIGKALYEYFISINFDVIGLSTSNGYDIEERYTDVIKIIDGCDLFINNAYHTDFQSQLLSETAGKIPYIISLGSIAGQFYKYANSKQDYGYNKNLLSVLHKKLSFTSSSKLLLLNVAMTENSTPDPGCTYNDIVAMCVHWLANPSFNSVDFDLSLTKTNLELIRLEFGVDMMSVIKDA